MRLAILLSTLLLVACGGTDTERRKPVEIETVDVDSGYDAQLSTVDDERGKQVEIALAGALPGDFPAELPVFSPASIVDFGPGFVELDSPVRLGEVRSAIESQVTRAGWGVVSGDDSMRTYSRAGRQVRVIIAAIGSGTRVRYEY